MSNNLGNAGWELVAVIQLDPSRFAYFFKRPKS